MGAESSPAGFGFLCYRMASAKGREGVGCGLDERPRAAAS